MAEYSIVVKPGSKKGPVVETSRDGPLVVYVRERAVDGRANEAIIVVLAKHFDVPKSYITIVRGHTSHRKLVRVS